jgi:hypothetical protein
MLCVGGSTTKRATGSPTAVRKQAERLQLIWRPGKATCWPARRSGRRASGVLQL